MSKANPEYAEIGTEWNHETDNGIISKITKKDQNDFRVRISLNGFLTREVASCVNFATARYLACAMHYGTKNEND